MLKKVAHLPTGTTGSTKQRPTQVPTALSTYSSTYVHKYSSGDRDNVNVNVVCRLAVSYLDNFSRLDVEGDRLGSGIVVQRLLAQHKLAGFSHGEVTPRHRTLPSRPCTRGGHDLPYTTRQRRTKGV